MSTILDTDIISIILRTKENDAAKVWYAAQNPEDIYLTSITLAELAQGIWHLDETHARRPQYINDLDRIENNFAGRILDFDRHAARIWGKLRGIQMQQGSPLPELDLQIAAIALHHDMAVATCNAKHFIGIGVNVINPFK